MLLFLVNVTSIPNQTLKESPVFALTPLLCNRFLVKSTCQFLANLFTPLVKLLFTATLDVRFKLKLFFKLAQGCQKHHDIHICIHSSIRSLFCFVSLVA